MRPLHRLLLATTALIAMAANPWQTQAGDFVNAAVSYQYGETAAFRVEWAGQQPAQQVYLFVRPQGGDTRVAEMGESPANVYQYSLDVALQPLRPFAPVEYWFQALTPADETVNSPVGIFTYADNRAEWQHLQDGPVEVFWQQGELDFGQAALNTALEGMDRVRSLLPFEPQETVRIYIYPSAIEGQSTLQPGQVNWFAGHATPDLGVAVVAVPPGPDEKFEIERQVPHEIMHIAQFLTIGSATAQLPIWFSEGQASLAELYPNPEYQHAIEQAVQTSSVLSMGDLCDVLPQNMQGAFLAYAQSASFVQYLHKNFGTSGLLGLMRAYQDGLGCSEAVQATFGESLEALDTRWRREELGVGEVGFAFSQLSPYLLLLGLFVIPVPLAWLVYRRVRSGQKE